MMEESVFGMQRATTLRCHYTGAATETCALEMSRKLGRHQAPFPTPEFLDFLMKTEGGEVQN